MEVVEHMEPAAQALPLDAEYQLARARLVREEEWAQESWEDGIENMIREERWRMLWERWARSRPQAMEESSLRGFKEVFKRVVVCHIDKHNSEGLLI